MKNNTKWDIRCPKELCNMFPIRSGYYYKVIKTIFHEFYHHLDNMTDGLYNSSDENGENTSLSWQFSDLLWEEFRKKK